MVMTTGEKWVSLSDADNDDEDDDGADNGSRGMQLAILNAGKALSIIANGKNNALSLLSKLLLSGMNEKLTTTMTTTMTTTRMTTMMPGKDYKMMHHVMSRLPPEVRNWITLVVTQMLL
jgi:hypothetical protein